MKPLYRKPTDSTILCAVKIKGVDRLYVLPQSAKGRLETEYGARFEANKIVGMQRILSGENNMSFTDDKAGDFKKFVHSQWCRLEGRGDYVAREIESSTYAYCVRPADKGEDAKYSVEKGLEPIRALFAEGKPVQFIIDTETFTLGKDRELVDYTYDLCAPVAIGSSFSGYITSGKSIEKVRGSYDKEVGLPHGTWTRESSVWDGCWKTGSSTTAVFDKGCPVSGTLVLNNGSDDKYYAEPVRQTTYVSYGSRGRSPGPERT